jgi:phosphoenolpyruvate-protein kinase (PTS system EI component)
MVPVVGAVQELEHVREEAEAVIEAVSQEAGVHLEKVIGTMIELPRACLTAAQIAASADFSSYGTNDLTQTTWGFPATTARPRFPEVTWTSASSASPRSRPWTPPAWALS